MYIILAIIAFGLLIAIHEFGHFIFAKLFGVRVNEFSIGMGPLLLKKQGKETLYALRLLPIGGYCAMEGEDESSEDPRAFTSQNLLKRIVILAAGPFMNLLAGFLVVIILFASATSVTTNIVAETAEGFPAAGEDGILAGDRMWAINGDRIYFASDLSLLASRDTDGLVELTIIRNGEKIQYDSFPLSLREYTEPDGTVTTRYGISFAVKPMNLGDRFQFSCCQMINYVRLIKFGLADLFSGAAGVKDLSGPVGIVSTMNEAAKSAPSRIDAIANFAYICAFIAVNLGVMNLLPIPALDGGRIFLGIISWLISILIGKHIDPKYEGIIHTVFLLLLLGLTVFILFNDVIKVIHG